MRRVTLDGMAVDRIATELWRRVTAAMKVRRESTDEEERAVELLKITIALDYLLKWTKLGIVPPQPWTSSIL
jgi:hypothetical protein